jgi:hypothetical protein
LEKVSPIHKPPSEKVVVLTDFGWEPPPEVQEKRIQVKPRMDAVCAGENTPTLVLLQIEVLGNILPI